MTLQKETEVEMAEQARQKITSSDLITDRKVVRSLCLLSTSMRWLASKAVQLRHIEDPENFSRNDGGNSGRLRRRWTLIDYIRPQHDENRPIYLPMTTETVGFVFSFLFFSFLFLTHRLSLPTEDKLNNGSAFDGVVTSFQELATTVLFTLRVETRCRVLYYLDKSMTEGNYCLGNLVSTPDANALALNTDIVWLDEDVSYALPEKETA